jgi:hypothetical protein
VNRAQAIACRAIFARATTLADGGWRVSFDLDESDAGKVAQVTALRDSVLFLTVIPEGMIQAEEREDEIANT